MTAHISEITQPRNVQPKNRLVINIAVVFLLSLKKATNTGIKYKTINVATTNNPDITSIVLSYGFS